jgi:hypothetical protein
MELQCRDGLNLPVAVASCQRISSVVEVVRLLRGGATPEENALLGTTDREVGERTGRLPVNVAAHWKLLGIVSYRKRIANAHR